MSIVGKLNVRFRTIKDFPAYKVSDSGSVISYHGKKPRALKPGKDKDGYLRVVLCNNKKKAYRRVHQLVLETFVGNRPDGHEGCHNDGIKNNNHINNLRWDTQKNNLNDRFKHGTTTRGVKNHFSTLTEDNVHDIRMLLKRGVAYKVIAWIFDVQEPCIGKIKNGRTWSWLESKTEGLYCGS